MAEQLSDLQKAALDFMIAYKQHDDSFIDTMADIANDIAKGAQAITDAATYVGHAVANYAQGNPAGAGGNAFQGITRVAYALDDVGGATLASRSPAPGEATASGEPARAVTLEELIKARHGIR